MSYKISDFSGDIQRRLDKIIDNHLFLMFFAFFVIVFGTCGIWISSLLINSNVTWNSFRDGFNTLAYISFCAPLLSVTVFDSVVRLMTKYSDDPASIDGALVVWYTILVILYFIVMIVLFAFGAKTPGVFSWFSFSAWVMALMYWALVNIDNDAYQKSSRPNGATGTDDFNQLRAG